MTITNLQDLNTKTIAQLQAAVDRINALIADPDIDLDDEARLLARRGALFSQITNQSLVQAHSKASIVVVEFTNAELKEIDKLEEKLDPQIIAGLKVNAILTQVPKLIDTASSIAMKITSHTAQAAAVQKASATT
jgi:hypothetical protein